MTTTTMNPETITEVYNSKRNELLNFARSFTHDHGRAEDVVQGAFLKLSQQNDMDSLGCVKWLFTVVRNDCLKTIRKNHRYVTPEEGELEQVADTATKPDESLDNSESFSLLSDRLAVELSKLSTLQQNCIRLRFFDELSYDEISSRLGISVSAVGFNLNHAKGKLQRLMSFSH